MHILFIHSEMESLAIEYLSAALKKEGHKVSLLFAPRIFQSTKFSLSLVPHKDVCALADIAIKQAPGLVCFSVNSDYFGWALQIAKAIKNTTSLPIIFGGVHATAVPEAVLENKAIDYVCVGEGEKALVHLVAALESNKNVQGINNIWFKKDGRVHKSPINCLEADLDSLPFPDKDLFFRCFPPFVGGAYTIMTSRGCINACSYCYNSTQRRQYTALGSKLIRRRSVENVIAELEDGAKKYNFARVSFTDDIFTFDLKWLTEFVTAYAKRIRRPYSCNVHPAWIDQGRIDLLVKSGCTAVFLGVQTISSELRQQVLNRYETTEKIVSAMEGLQRSGLFVYAGFIFGIPGQGLKEWEEIALFCNRHRVGFSDVFWLRYYPGSEIINKALQANILQENDVHIINESLEFQPFTQRGVHVSLSAIQLRNLIYLMHFLPVNFVNWVIRSKLYSKIPKLDMHAPCLLLRMIQQCLLGKRSPFLFFSLYDYWRYYTAFMFKKFVLTTG